MFDAIESIGSLQKGAFIGLSEFNDLVEELSEEGIAVFVLSSWKGYALVVVQLLVSDLFGHHVEFLHIGVGVDKFLELLVEHLEAVDVDKILDVFETVFEVFELLAEFDDFAEKLLWS